MARRRPCRAFDIGTLTARSAPERLSVGKSVCLSVCPPRVCLAAVWSSALVRLVRSDFGSDRVPTELPTNLLRRPIRIRIQIRFEAFRFRSSSISPRDIDCQFEAKVAVAAAVGLRLRRRPFSGRAVAELSNFVTQVRSELPLVRRSQT